VIPVLTAAEARDADARVIRSGVPGVVLMDQASRAVAEVVRDLFPSEAARGVVVLCGPGNNGGDGYGCARWLAGWGVPVRVWSLASASSGDAGVFRAACLAVGVADRPGLDGAGLVVDAVFGTGISRPINGDIAEVLQSVAHSGLPVVAVDVPSGLDSDTGASWGPVLPAKVTVSFGSGKPGLYAEPGADLAGTVRVVDIGLGVVRGCAEIPTQSDLPRWPSRAGAEHKGRGGHVWVVAGSARFAGAAALACRGALAAGCGLVTLAAPRALLGRLAPLLPPEVMWEPADGEDTVERVDNAWGERCSAAVFGPGLCGGEPARPGLAADLRGVWRMWPVPVLFDADALPFAYGPGGGPRVLTPHPGEAARRLGRSIPEIQADRFGAVRELAEDGAVALLKGRNTLIAEPGQPVWINPTGSPILATAGSGDVLAGVIGALLAQGLGPRESATLGAFVHGRAGERLAARGRAGWTASDLLPEIRYVASELA
jgi:NAD(P)H-hydrate epimerase